MTKTKKPLYIVTYIIALLCLVAGFIVAVPFSVDNMLVVQLPEAFKAVIGSSSEFSGSLIYTFGSFSFDVGAVCALVYAVVTVLGIILLIPSLIGKKGKSAKGSAYVIEIIAVIVLLCMLINEIGYSAEGVEILDILGLLIALGGTYIMLIIQSMGDKKGSGVLKSLMTILGVICVLATLDLTVISVYKSQYGNLGGLFAQAADGSLITGAYALKYLIETTLLGSGDYIFGSGTTGVIASWCAGVAVLLVIINFCIDLILMGPKARKGAHVFDCVRYALEFLVAVVAFILLFIADGTAIGLLMAVIVGVSFIMTIISIVRAIVFRTQPEEEAVAEPEEEELEEVMEEEAEEEETVEMTPVEPEPVSRVTEDGVVRYKEREPYNGPEDSFISRLTEAEKKEFAKLFLDKIYGPYENIPDYVVDGDNRDFFDSVFVYLGKFRPIVSDGLMRKLYSEKNLLN